MSSVNRLPSAVVVITQLTNRFADYNNHEVGDDFSSRMQKVRGTSVLSRKFVYKIGQPIRGFDRQFWSR